MESHSTLDSRAKTKPPTDNVQIPVNISQSKLVPGAKIKIKYRTPDGRMHNLIKKKNPKEEVNPKEKDENYNAEKVYTRVKEEPNYDIEEDPEIEEFIPGYRGGNVGSIWMLINAMQYMALLPMMNLDIPELLVEFLKSLFRWDLFPNLFEYAFDGYDLTEDKPFARAEDFGITSSAFFLNAGNLFLIAFIIVMLYPVVKLASNPDSWANEVRKEFIWNVPVRVWIELYTITTFAATLQLANFSLEDPARAANSVFALIFFTASAITPFTTLCIIGWNKDFTQLQQHFSVLFMEFKQSKRWASFIYYLIFFMSRLGLSLSLVFLQSYSGLQLGINFSFCVMSLMYGIFVRPFYSRQLSFVHGFLEGLSALVILLLGTYKFPWGSDFQSFAQWAVVVLVCVIFIGGFITAVGQQFAAIWTIYRKSKAVLMANFAKELKKKKVQELNTTSVELDASEMPLTTDPGKPSQMPPASLNVPVNKGNPKVFDRIKLRRPKSTSINKPVAATTTELRKPGPIPRLATRKIVPVKSTRDRYYEQNPHLKPSYLK